MSLKRSSWLIGVGAALLTVGCESSGTTDPDPPTPVQIQVQPAGSIELGVGDTVRLRIDVRSGDPGIIQFTSSAPEVARVTADGLITGLTGGLTTISVTPSAAPQAMVAVLARVVEDVEPPPPAASAIINSITTDAGEVVDPEEVSGTIRVDAAVRRGPGTLVQVLLGDRIACEQTLTGSAQATVSLSCMIATDRYDAETGVPTFQNGARPLGVRILDASGSPVGVAGGAQLHLRNQNRLLIEARGSVIAEDTLGAEWHGGDIRVTALPVLYDAGESLRQVTFTHAADDGTVISRTRTTPPFETLFEKATLGEIVVDSFIVRATGALQSGRSVQGESAPIRVDLVGPEAGSLIPVEWVGASRRFDDLYDPATESDAGVGRIVRHFLAGGRDATLDNLVQSGTVVQKGSDLADSRAAGYRLAALVCDVLENCTPVLGFTFGVDTQAPRIVSVSLPVRSVNPSQDISLGINDEGSGIGDRPLIATVEVLRADDAATCGPEIEGKSFPGRSSGGECLGDTIAAVAPVPRTTSGYYTYSLRPIDRAGNVGPLVSRAVLIDRTAPVVRDFSVEAGVAPGGEMDLSASVADNLDLAEMTFEVVFGAGGTGGTISLPFSPHLSLGTPFNGNLVASGSGSATIPFPRSLTTGSGAPGTRSTVLADSVRAGVRDAAGLVGRSARALPSSSGGTSDPFQNIAQSTVAISNDAICTAGCLPSDPTSTTVQLQLRGGLSLQQPFDRIYLYRRTPGGDVRLIGTTSSFRQEDVLGNRTITYTITYEPSAGVTGEQKVFAVGVAGQSRAGAALAWDELNLSLFRR